MFRQFRSIAQELSIVVLISPYSTQAVYKASQEKQKTLWKGLLTVENQVKMSVASKRRFVTNQIDSEMFLPSSGDIIARILGARGNNLHEVEDQNGDLYMVSMPTKFRKAVWIRRGQFVILHPIEEGDKVKAEIENVLDEENVLYIREMKLWPSRFEDIAEQMTRESKRGEKSVHPMIDDDMMPPSGSESDDDEELSGDSECEDEDSEEDSDSNAEMEKFNPNRAKAPNNM